MAIGPAMAQQLGHSVQPALELINALGAAADDGCDPAHQAFALAPLPVQMGDCSPSHGKTLAKGIANSRSSMHREGTEGPALDLLLKLAVALLLTCRPLALVGIVVDFLQIHVLGRSAERAPNGYLARRASPRRS
jgi:hypothetical protein